MFTKAQQMTAILSINGISPSYLVSTNSIGRVLLRMVYFCLVNPMTRSTCILTLASFREVSMSTGDSQGRSQEF